MDDSIFSLSRTIKVQLSDIYSNHELGQVTSFILQKKLGITATQILTNPETKISISDYNQIMDWVKRLKNHEPLQYVLGETEFYGLKLLVAPGVLIPRPETEELVDSIVKCNKIANPRILDIGTGSGCIAIALAKNIGASQVDALDISEDALRIARKNAESNMARINFILGDIFQGNSLLPHRAYDIVVSNPPYVTQSEKKLMQHNVLDFEPRTALFVDDQNPLIFYRQISIISKNLLNPGGWLYFEINENFGPEMCELLQQEGYLDIEIIKDINKKNRIAKAQWKQ